MPTNSKTHPYVIFYLKEDIPCNKDGIILGVTRYKCNDLYEYESTTFVGSAQKEYRVEQI